MIIEFIFSTSNYLQKNKKKLVIMITLVMIIRNIYIYIHQKDAVYYINVLMLSCKHY